MAAWSINRSQLGMLKITGQTRLDLLHRMSTQDLRNMASGEGRATILTTEIGRIIDRLIIYTSSDTVFALTGENNADNVARYLMRYVFFQDDFHLQNISPKIVIYGVYGADCAEALAAAGLDGRGLARHHWLRQEEGDGVFYLHRTDPIEGDGFLLMALREHEEGLLTRLRSADIGEVSEEQFEFARIGAGLPRFGRELTRDYIPLEAMLWPDVSFTKGCYIGQEIIARMESRGKLAKKLVQLRADRPIPSGTELWQTDRLVGSITSSAQQNGQTVALGYVKTTALEKDEAIFAKAGEEQIAVELKD